MPAFGDLATANLVGSPKVVEIELGALRGTAAAMLAAGAALPLLGHPGIGCPLRTLTGIPCPLCGMSTSVEDSLRLRIVDAVQANPLGVVVTVVALAVLVARKRPTLRIPVVSIYLTLAALWMFELVRFGVV